MCKKQTLRLVGGESALSSGRSKRSKKPRGKALPDAPELLARLARQTDRKELERELLLVLGGALPAGTKSAVSLDPGSKDPSMVATGRRVRPASRRDAGLSLLVVPIIDEGELQGWIGLDSDSLPKEPEAHQAIVETLCRLGEVAALPARNAHLVAGLREQSMKDDLTGLNNRRAFREALEREIVLAERHEQPLTVLMIDIDGFKRINDDLGHAAGDRVLREFAAALGASLRSTDFVARLGGDEFVALLPKAERRQAERLRSSLASRLRRVEAWLIRRSGHHWPLTFSIGITDTRECGPDGDRLVEEADRRLYMDKAVRSKLSRARDEKDRDVSANPLRSES